MTVTRGAFPPTRRGLSPNAGLAVKMKDVLGTLSAGTSETSRPTEPAIMTSAQVIIHERLATWTRQLRPRFSGWPVHWSESRSGLSLVRAARLSACPVIVLDLGHDPLRGLEDLGEVGQTAPSALSVVLDPARNEEIALLARELGATLVLGGQVVPPVLESLLQRWIPLSIQRAKREGWCRSVEPEPGMMEFAH